MDLRATIKELRSTIANLNETIDELKRKIFGTSSEKTRRPDQEEGIQEEETVTVVKEHTRTRRKKSVRADLYEALPIKEISCDVTIIHCYNGNSDCAFIFSIFFIYVVEKYNWIWNIFICITC